MTLMAPGEMAKIISAGLLSFPVTHFKPDLGFDEHAYRQHRDWLLRHAVSGLFAAGGTGEFFSLTRAAASLDATPDRYAHRSRICCRKSCKSCDA